MSVDDPRTRYHIYALFLKKDKTFGQLWWDFFTLIATREVAERECYGLEFVRYKLVTTLSVVLFTQAIPT